MVISYGDVLTGPRCRTHGAVGSLNSDPKPGDLLGDFFPPRKCQGEITVGLAHLYIRPFRGGYKSIYNW